MQPAFTASTYPEGILSGFYRGIPRRPSRFFEDVENDHIGDMEFNKSIMFDGMRGKICFADPIHHYKNMVIVDIE